MGVVDWISAERRRFVIWLPVFMAAGVVAYDALTVEPPVWSGAAGMAVTLLLARIVRSAWWRLTTVPLLALLLGFVAAQVATWRAPPVPELPRRATVVSGTVQAVEPLPQGRRITIVSPRLDDGPPLTRTLRVRLRAGDEIDLASGDSVRLRALVEPPAPPAYPGAWDLQRDAFFSGAGGYGFALGRAERLDRAGADRIGGWLQGLREAIGAQLRAALPAPEAAIAATLLTGATAAIPEADRATFRDSGLAHLLAVAGLHIGIVMAWVFGATRLGLVLSERVALHWPVKAIAALAALAAGGFYMLLTGAHVPIIRSFAMASLVTLGVVVGRRALSLRGLALAMAALILIAPWEVLGVSFQMSFSAVLALVAGYEALRPALARLYGEGAWWRRLLGHGVALALTSALAGTASAPFGAYHFGHVQLYYIVANVVAVPLTALWVMPMGMLALLLMPMHAAGPVLTAMGWGIDLVLLVGRGVASWPAAVLVVPHMPAWGLVVTALGIAWLGIWRTRLRLFGLGVIALGALSPLLIAPPDALVSADARLIGLRTAEGVFLQALPGASRFTRDAWLQFWAVRDAARLPVAGTAGGAIACDAGGCRLHRDSLALRLVRGDLVCDADVLLDAEPLPARCTPMPPFVDRFSVWRDGAYAVWLRPDGVRILSDRAVRGTRPWVVRARARSAAASDLPAAPAEVLPEE
jgi:competence protein ComEC